MITLPSPNPILNIAQFFYNYLVSGTTISSNIFSNIVSTKVNIASLSQNKVSNVDYATVGNTISYSIGISNFGNVEALTVTFIDTIPSSLLYQTGTLRQDGSPIPGNPSTGITLNSILPYSTTTISFVALVTTLPTTNPIKNSSDVSYSFIVTPGSTPYTNLNTSNIAQTTISQALINSPNGFIKTASPSNGNLGTTITYTVSLINSGNTDANNVAFIDTIPTNTLFIPNSLTLNNITQPGANPNPPSGFFIGTLQPNVLTTITFQVIVTTLPTVNPIKNTAYVGYNYTVFPTIPNGITSSTISTSTSTTIVQAIIDNATGGMNKKASIDFGNIGDTITYTISLTNTGNTAANNVVFIDTIPNGTILITNSVYVNNTLVPGGNPNPPTGVPLGTINSGHTTTIQFSVKVTSVPNPNPIVNTAFTTFTYTTDPLFPNGSTGTGTSNPYTTTISNATIDNNNGNGLTKSSNPSYTAVGTTITYTISINNTGNVPANNVVFIDTIPSQTTFISNSVALNGVVQPGANPQIGVPVGTVNPNSPQTITFNVVVITLPTSGKIENQGFVNYNFTILPTIPNGATGSGGSNINVTTISQAVIDNGSGGLSKTSDLSTYTLGDTITYTISLKNTGNTPANNVVFMDTLPNIGYFIPGTFKYNSVILPVASPLPPNGVNIGTLNPGVLNTVSFQVKVTTLPTSNPVVNTATVNFTYQSSPTIPTGTPGSGTSNPLTTSIVGAIITNTVINGVPTGFTKTTNPEFASIGDVITFTCVLTNTGNIPANNIVFIDTIPNGTTLIQNSVLVNGLVQPGANPSPPTGVSLGSLNPNASTTIAFKVIVLTAPNPNPIVNQAFTTFTFTTSPTLPNNQTGTGVSQITTTTVVQASFANLGFTKSSNPSYGIVGSTITYTIVLNNLGNTNANNVVFTDTISQSTTFVPGSVYFNSVNNPSGNPSSGINLGSIVPNSPNTLTFQVVINTIPSPNPISNQGIVNYTYTVVPTLPNGVTGSNLSNISQTTVSQAIIDGSSGGVIKSSDKSSYILGDTITYTIAIINKGNTPANNSVFIDTIPGIGYFIPNTLKFNNVAIPGASPLPPNGYNMGTLNPGVLNTISFSVMVTTLPTVNPVTNTASVGYNYTLFPTLPNGQTGVGVSNPLPTSIVGALISNTIVGGTNPGFSKTTSRTFAQIDDIITFTATLTNTGNVPANNVVFIDTIPNGTSLVTNSVTVNGSPQPGANPAPPTGIPLGTINNGSSSTVQFQVLVLTIPSPNPIVNQAFTTFNYTSSPTLPNNQIGTGTSEITTTTINNANFASIGFIKNSTPAYGNVGTTLTFTISLTNLGTTIANNIVFTDTIPQFTNFVAGSVIYNNTPISGNPGSGIMIGSIAPSSLNTLTFNVVVTSVPTSNVINNQGIVDYTYTAYPTLPNGVTGTNISNISTSTISQAIIDNNGNGLNKSSDKENYILGDTITYTVSLKNTGNTPANNVVFIDTIPNVGYFVPNSFTLNGAVISGASPLPPTGVNIGTLNVGSLSTVTFKVVITTLPTVNPVVNTGAVTFNYTIFPTIPNGATGGGSSNPLPNTVVTAIISNTVVGGAAVGFIKSASTNNATLGDQITFTITLANTGNTPANNVIFIDTTPTGTTFVSDSVSLNGSTVFGANPNPPGIPLGTINPGSPSVIKFKVLVVTIPTQNPISNIAFTTFTYTSSPTLPNGNVGTGTSTQTLTTITNAGFTLPNGIFTKSATPSNATIGTTITYTIAYKNGGNTPANNLVFIDTIPSGLTFINGSVTLNGAPLLDGTPQTGISLPPAMPNVLNTISFLVNVTSIPNPPTLVNQGLFNFNYTVNPSIPNGQSGSVLTNTISTGINYVDISTVTNGFVKSQDNSFVQVGDTITYTITVKNNGNTTATSVIITDTLPTSLSYVSGSSNVNGLPNPGDPQNGISIGTLAPNIVATVSFKAIVLTLPSSNKIVNNAQATYSFVVDPSTGLTTTLTNTSSTSTISVVNAKVISLKTMDKAYATVGDTITYTVSYTNIGNVSVQNITLIDSIPSGTTYLPNSSTLNGVPILGGNPTVGINIGTLSPNMVNTVSFIVTVTSIPSINPISNIANSTFNYIVSPTLPPLTTILTATSPSTQIEYASFNPNNGGFNKSSNPTNFNIGTTVTYTLTLTNLGNTTAENILLQDTIPNGLQLVPNSLFLNGSPLPGNISTGISIPNISAGSTAIVTFQCTVISIPSSYKASNQANISYQFIVDPSLPVKNSSNISNEVISMINVASISASKYGNKSLVFIGSSIVYTLLLTNQGNVSAKNVFVVDTLPDTMNYLSNSLVINGAPTTGLSPISGFTIPNILPGATTTITFMAVANSIPRGMVAVNNASINYSYVSDPSIPITTTTITTSSDTVIVAYNGNNTKPLPICVTESPNIGLMSKLSPKSSSVDCGLKTCGSNYKVEGLCTAAEYACVSKEIPLYKMWQEQNFNSTFSIPNLISEVESIKASINIIRSDKIQTPNTSNCANYEGKVLSGFKEIIEGVIKFTITYINSDGQICAGEFYDLFSSYIVINPKYSCGEFDVRGCIEDLEILSLCDNQVTFSTTLLLYLVPSNSTCMSTTCACQSTNVVTDCISNNSLCSNILTFLNPCDYYWNEFNVFFTEDTSLYNIGSLNSITADISNINKKIISTPKPSNMSNESLNLTGRMLLITFVLNIKINYRTNDGSNVIKRLKLVVPASTYIVVDSIDLCNSDFVVSTCIEDIYACNLDGNSVFTNTTILVKAKVCTPPPCCY